MANVDNPNGFRAIAPAGTTLPMYEYTTGSNVGLLPGDAVYLLTTGLLALGTATAAAILGVCQSIVTAETGVQKKALVIPAYKDIVFSGQCSGTFAQTDIGEAVDIEGTSGIMEINENATSLAVAQIVGIEGGIDNAVGANTRVLFTWAKSQWTV